MNSLTIDATSGSRPVKPSFSLPASHFRSQLPACMRLCYQRMGSPGVRKEIDEWRNWIWMVWPPPARRSVRPCCAISRRRWRRRAWRSARMRSIHASWRPWPRCRASEFVPPAGRLYAFRDGAVPIGHGQTISQPYIVALMTDLLMRRGRRHHTRNRYRLRLSGGGAGASGASRLQHRDHRGAGGCGRCAPGEAGLRQCHRPARRRMGAKAGRTMRPSTASSSRPLRGRCHRR